MTRSSVFEKLSLRPVMLWTLLFGGIPVLMVVGAAFMRRGERDFLLPELSLEGWGHILNPVFLKILLNSLYLAGITALVCLLIGYPFAWILARHTGKHKKTLLILAIIPFWTNSLIRTYAMVFILKTKGILNGILLAAGLIDRPLQLMYSDFAVFSGLAYTLLPFMIMPLYASIEKLDSRMMEASRDLGAGTLRTFVHVALPLTMPGIVAGTMLVFLPALGMFYIPDLLGGAKSILLGNYIKSQFLTFRNWPAGSAASTLLTLFMLLMLWMRTLASKNGKSRVRPWEES